MANLRADPQTQMGALPTFGDSAVPVEQDVNSYSDRQTAKEAGLPGETQARVFSGLAGELGSMADQAAQYEGKQAGLAAGNDPNYRPNADESIRGRAFNEAANLTYINNLDAQSKQQATDAYSQWLQLPPGQRTPDVLQKTFGGIQKDFTDNHVFPEIQGEFNARFANQTSALMQGAQRNFEEQVHNNAQASFMTRDAANGNAVLTAASTGLDSNAPQVAVLTKQALDGVNQGVASGAIRPQEGVERKQTIVDSVFLADRQARYAAASPSDRAAIRASWQNGPAGVPAPPWPPQASANWSDGITFGKAGPISAQTSANDPLAPEVKGGLEALHGLVGPVTITSTTEGKHDPNSYHYQGKAVDIALPADDADREKLIDSARQAGFTGFGIGATHLHLDMRPTQDGRPIVFGDAYSGPIAGKDIPAWQTHLNALGSPIAPGASLDGAPSPSLSAMAKLNTWADSVDKAGDSQMREQEKGQVAEIGAFRKQVVSGVPVLDDAYQSMKRSYAASPSPAVAQAWADADRSKSLIDSYRGQRPETILADIDNAQGALANAGGVSPAQKELFDDARKYYGKLKEDLATNSLGRAAAEGVVSPIAPLNGSDPNLKASILARSAAVSHTADYYNQSANYFLPSEGASFAQSLSNVRGGLAAVADPPTLNAMAEDEGFKKSLIGNSRSGDPARMKASFDAMNAIANASPMQFEARFGKEATTSLDHWNSQLGYQSTDEAAKTMMALNDPSQSTARQYRDEAANAALKTVDENAVVKMFAQHNALVGMVTGDTKAPASLPEIPQASAGALRNDYVTAYKDFFALSGSADQASASALAAISKKWGVSPINGNRLMPYPPERAYPAINGSFDWLGKQLDADVKAKVGDMGIDTIGEGGEAVDDRTAPQESARAKYTAPRALVADAQTKADLAAGKAPSYRVIVQDPTGQFHALEQSPGVPFRFFGDPTADQAKERAEFNAAHDAEMRNPRLANPPAWLNP